MVLGRKDIWLYCPMGYEMFFEKFEKPSSPSYILDARYLKTICWGGNITSIQLCSENDIHMSF